ncbi:glycerophosphodiester phosphodiesterase [Haloferula sp. A504]|uniref:glycerophosphodiester phosphodiesterase n=1 Tax=Haloferula sp. A504 TaxID=3373601 RepID=UPI0031C9DAF7|nr:glycerophosphodiester phosphodiesterase [Verrucomicrobiaceae bacterium E54]
MRLLAFLLLSTLLHANPALIAHRGASGDAPENTLAAFRLAWAQGADGIEGDFMLSKDGRIVCIHDKDTQRVSNRNLVVARTNAADLRSLDVGSWKSPEFAGERIPLLGEVLAILPEDKWFFLEVKCGPEIVPHLQTELTSADPDQVVIISFNPAVIQSCRKMIPRFQAHFLSKLDGMEDPGNEVALRKQLVDIAATGLQFSHQSRIDRRLVSSLKADGLQIACWTVNDPKTAARVAALGVDFITTDRPAALRKQTPWLE